MVQYVMSEVSKWSFWSPEEAGLTVIGCAWSESVFKQTGRYFVPVFREDPGSSQARDGALAKIWYDETEALLKSKGFL
jgi:hypothetical protein